MGADKLKRCAYKFLYKQNSFFLSLNVRLLSHSAVIGIPTSSATKHILLRELARLNWQLNGIINTRKIEQLARHPFQVGCLLWYPLSRLYIVHLQGEKQINNSAMTGGYWTSNPLAQSIKLCSTPIQMNQIHFMFQNVVVE